MNSVTPSTRTRNWENSCVRAASCSASRASPASARRPGYPCLTIHGQGPDGPRARGAVIDEPMLDAGGRDERVPGLQRVLGGAEPEASATLEDDVELVLIPVGVRLLLLAGRHAVEVEQGARRRRQGDLRHPVGLELRVVLNPDTHRRPSPATLRDERASRPDLAHDTPS